ncbi:MAG: hypothetical protein MZW92_28845 [Comamonadaceae bacterium]|nr:hypothetical protein [Comamonadaceae bacterium]
MVDRSLKEVEPGVYAAQGQAAGAGPLRRRVPLRVAAVCCTASAPRSIRTCAVRAEAAAAGAVRRQVPRGHRRRDRPGLRLLDGATGQLKTKVADGRVLSFSRPAAIAPKRR